MRGGAAGQDSCLRFRPRLPQSTQKLGDGARVIEGDVCGGSTGKQSGSLRRKQGLQQRGDGARFIEGRVCGGAVGQDSGLRFHARLPQSTQQQGDGTRVIEGCMRGGSTSY